MVRVSFILFRLFPKSNHSLTVSQTYSINTGKQERMTSFEDQLKHKESGDDVSLRSTTSIALPTIGRILCCMCGVSIIPNAAAMCENCLQQQPEFWAFSSDMKKEIVQCPKCDRWSVGQHEMQTWAAHEMESPGLLAACLKKIAPLQQTHGVNFLDAGWIWTEPHSKRLQFFVDTQRQVLGTPVQQRIVCTYVVRNSQCKDCIVKNSEHTWSASLQIRQSRGKVHTANVESLLIKEKLGALMNEVQTTKDGLDLFFDTRQQLEKVMGTLQRFLPTTVRSKANKLVSRDSHTNASRSEYVVVLELVPLVKGDLVLLTKPLVPAATVGLVRRVTSTVQIALFNSSSSASKLLSLPADKYFKSPDAVSVLVPHGFGKANADTKQSSKQNSKQSSRQQLLSRFIVLDITPIDDLSSVSASYASSSMASSMASGSLAGRRAVVEVLSEEDMQTQYTCETDLGHVLTVGDSALGIDTTRLFLQDEDNEGGDSVQLNGVTVARASVPEVVLLSKVFESVEGADKSIKRVSGGGGVKKRNRIPPWRRVQPTIVEGAASEEVDDDEDHGQEEHGETAEEYEGEEEEDVWEDEEDIGDAEEGL